MGKIYRYKNPNPRYIKTKSHRNNLPYFGNPKENKSATERQYKTALTCFNARGCKRDCKRRGCGMNNNSSLIINNSDFLLYQTKDGSIKIDVRLEDETVWVSQSQMQQLFQKSKATISEHIKNVFKEGELDEKVVVRNFRTTTQHGAINET